MNYGSCECFMRENIFYKLYFFFKAFIYPTSRDKHTQIPIFETHIYIDVQTHTYINNYKYRHIYTRTNTHMHIIHMFIYTCKHISDFSQHFSQ